DAANLDGLWVLAGVLVGETDLGDLVEALGLPVAFGTGVDGVGAPGVPDGDAEADLERAPAGHGPLEVERGGVGVAGDVHLQAAGHDHAEAVELDERVLEGVGGEARLAEAVGERAGAAALGADQVLGPALQPLQVVGLEEEPLVPVDVLAHALARVWPASTP